MAKRGLLPIRDRTATALLSLLVAWLAVGCGSAATPAASTSSPPTAAASQAPVILEGDVGQPIDIPDVGTLVVSSAAEWAPPGARPCCGVRQVAVQISIAATLAGLDLSTDSFRLVEHSTGLRHAPVTGGRPPELAMPLRVEAGQIASGFVTFEIPVEAVARLLFAPSPAAQVSVELTAIAALPTPAPTVRSSASPTVRPVPTGPGTVPLPILSPTVTGASTIYFSISGLSPLELLASEEAGASQYCGRDALACMQPRWTAFEISPTYTPTGCTVTGVNITAGYTVWLPRWTSPPRVYSALLDWWQVVLAHAASHEAQHIGIENDRLPTLRSSLLNAPCASVPSIEAAWVASLEAAQDAFDAADATWTPPKYTGP